MPLAWPDCGVGARGRGRLRDGADQRIPAGAPIGWHRDAPQYEIVAGISLLSSCRMKFRPYVPPGAKAQGRRTATHEVTLERRSGYLITADAPTASSTTFPP